MTVQAQNSVQYYNGPIEIGTELSIVEFTFIDNSHVSAKVRGNTEVWQYGYDYTVSGAQTLIRTITVQRRVAENEVLAVYLDVPITQNISPEEGGNFPASTNEYVLDKLTHISQMLDERVKRSLQISIDTPFSGTLPAPEPNKALKISPDGNSFVMSDYDPDVAMALTENFKNQAQQAAVEAENQKNVAIQQAQNAAIQAANAKASADNAAELNQQLTNNFNTYSSSLQGDFSTYTDNLISTKEDGMASLANASNAVRQTQITNCLLEVPQRVKYTLTDRTLTIKASSVVIVPYGVTDKTSQFPIGSRFLHDNFKVYDTHFADGKFFVWAEIQSDIVTTANASMGNGLYTLGIRPQLNSIGARLASTQQGSGDGSNLKSNDMYYHTVSNAITQYLNGVNEDVNCSLPIFLINKDNTGYTSIDQVFNGLGYIGSTIWVDKDVKYLVSNGRNEDRTLNNIEVTTHKVSTSTITGTPTGTYSYVLGSNHNIYHGSGWYYEEANNYVRTANGAIALVLFQNPKLVVNAGKIESFEIKQPFRAVDYNDYNDYAEKTNYLEQNSLTKSQITNCVLEIPQRIKLELNDGILTLKAGSVAIAPFGTRNLTSDYPIGSMFQHENFKVVDTQFINGKFFVWAEVQSDMECVAGTSNMTAKCFIDFGSNTFRGNAPYDVSGNVAPADNAWWYDTTNNTLGFWVVESQSLIRPNSSFPLSIVTSVSQKIASVGQVFNGMGFIGSTVWVDKEVKGLISNGRNKDRTLNNIAASTNKITVITSTTSNWNFNLVLTLYGEVKSNNDIYTIDDVENNYYYTSINRWQSVSLAKGTFGNDGVVTFFSPKQPFRAIDYSDSSTVSGWAMPSNKYIDLTLGASSSTYTAPANGYLFLEKISDAAGQYANIQCNDTDGTYLYGSELNSTKTGNYVRITVPISKGIRAIISYNLGGATRYFRFIYAQGEV